MFHTHTSLTCTEWNWFCGRRQQRRRRQWRVIGVVAIKLARLPIFIFTVKRRRLSCRDNFIDTRIWHFALKLVLPELTKPDIARIVERIASKVVLVEWLDILRMNSYWNWANSLLLVLVDDILPIGPAFGADDQEAICQIQMFDGGQHTANCHALAEADDDICWKKFVLSGEFQLHAKKM